MDDLISRQAAIDGKICIQRSNGVEIYDDYAVPVEYLEQLPPAQLSTNLAEVGTDCISRRQAINALSTITLYKGSIPFNTAVMRIEQLPPIQPKKGKWHYSDGKPARIGMSFGVICDQCGTESEYCTNFCGECGADMRGEQNG